MMKYILSEYLPLASNPKANNLHIHLYYSLGGMNYFTGRPEGRGYYLSVSPVSRSDQNGIVCESYTAFTGTKRLLLPCQRKSAKNEGEALKLVDEQREVLIRHVLEENGLALADAA